MTLQTTVIDSAVNKKYSDFSATIKTELQSKLSNHEVSIKYASDFDKIQTMKTMFAKINDVSEE